jgi:uncharacterized protein YndB with AHSA1/START domain
MTERSVNHATIVIERVYDATPAQVFAAWSDPEALLRWGNPGGDWDVAYDRFDFRVGGGDVSRFGPKGTEAYVNEAQYLDIVPDERIISAGSMIHGEKRLFAGMLTVEFRSAGAGCRLTMTEQGAFLDGHDLSENHEAGWNTMLDNLAEELRRDAAAA